MRRRASFGSFRIAVLYKTMGGKPVGSDDVSRAINVMNFFIKRFRSKASSAGSLSPGRFVNRRRMDFDSLPTPDCDTVSWRERVMYLMVVVYE